MHPSDKMIMLIGSSSKKSNFEGKRQNISTDNRGIPLNGIKYDINGFQKKFNSQQPQIIETSQDEQMLLSKKYIINWIKQKFQHSKYQVYLFYTGHGHENGDWAIETIQKPDGDCISLDEIVQIWKKHRPTKKSNLTILMDSCHSGYWCYRLGDIEQKGLNISIYASCERQETAKDCKGGLLLKCIYGTSEQFKQNCKLLYNQQNPVFLKNGYEKVIKLQKQQIKQIQHILLQESNVIIKVENKEYNDGFYTGEMMNQERNGKGVMKYKNGNRYDGEWKDDKKHGKGTEYETNQVKFVGEWKCGKKNGKGIKYFIQDGDIFEGTWKDDEPNGQIICNLSNGDVFVCQYKNGKRNGKALYYYADGRQEFRRYENGQEISSQELN